MNIRVRLLATGEIIEIAESDFDEFLHERVDPGLAQTLAAADSVNEFETALEARDDRIRQQTIQTVMGQLAAEGLGQERTPPNVPHVSLEEAATRRHQQGNATPYGSAPRATPAVGSRYRGLPLELGGDIRSVQGDQEIKSFLIALARKDYETLSRLERKSRVDHKRANEMLIGASDATSGLGADTTGGRLVPLPLSQLISTILQRNATMRQIAQVFTSDAETLRIVLQTGHVTPAWEPELDTLTEVKPSYSSKLLMKKKMAFITPVSNELLNDSAFNIGSLIAQEAAQTMADEEDTQFATSDGTGGQPTQGLDLFADALTASHEIAAKGVGTDEVNLAHLNDMFFGVHKPYRRLGTWVGPDSTLKLLSQMVDGMGRPILNMQNAAANVVSDQYPGAIGQIFNRPVVEAPVASGRLYFGDIRRAYMILDSGSVQAMASEHAGFENDIVKFRFIKRVDGRGGNGGLTTKRTFVYSEGITAVS